MVERSLIGGYHGSPYAIDSVEKYYVKTDEPYRLQYGDRTVEVMGEADLIFEDVQVEGHSFWVIRNDRLQGDLRGYVFSDGSWREVSEDTDYPVTLDTSLPDPGLKSA